MEENNKKEEKDISWLPVVVGLLRKQDRLLLGRRPFGDVYSGVWEFPGGKIKRGEHPQEALKRELKEELGILSLKKAPLKLSLSYWKSPFSLLLLFYEITVWERDIQPLYHTELKWMRTTELSKWPLHEANRKYLDEIISCLSLTSER